MEAAHPRCGAGGRRTTARPSAVREKSGSLQEGAAAAAPGASTAVDRSVRDHVRGRNGGIQWRAGSRARTGAGCAVGLADVAHGLGCAAGLPTTCWVAEVGAFALRSATELLLKAVERCRVGFVPPGSPSRIPSGRGPLVSRRAG